MMACHVHGCSEWTPCCAGIQHHATSACFSHVAAVLYWQLLLTKKSMVCGGGRVLLQMKAVHRSLPAQLKAMSALPLAR